ncbi:hypothetical protein U1Q18_033119, partial [Sarracenia purpurea var. burkii]
VDGERESGSEGEDIFYLPLSPGAKRYYFKMRLTLRRIGNRRSAGFTDEERQSFETNFLSKGFVDTFREQHPGVVGYTYWGYRHGGRKTNKDFVNLDVNPVQMGECDLTLSLWESMQFGFAFR